MTEAERNSFFAHSTQRAPGKRQIKPTVAVTHLTSIPVDDEEDDEEYKAECDSQGSGSSSESSCESEEDDNGGEEDGLEEDDPSNIALYALPSSKENSAQDPICTLCLNLTTNAVKEEVMRCDKCGLAVHESCYAADVGEIDDKSLDSSSSTEPWFCEPCLFDLAEPPHCELCPSRYGAFKKSDIGGSWVHLLCGLYIPSITFGDVERLSAVSWQEMDFKAFGRKSCMGCSDRFESRTGLVLPCDAALCKHHYHVTCAQKLGLLVDKTDSIDAENHEAHDIRFIHCKKHSEEEEVRRKREKYNRMMKQEERRMIGYGKRKLSDREEEKRKSLLERYRKAHAELVASNLISWPTSHIFDTHSKKCRRARHLHTSARFLEAFGEKAELANVSKEQFQKQFVKVRGEQLPFLAPGFSVEFVNYFDNREKNVQGAEEKRLERLKQTKLALRETLNNHQKIFEELEQKNASKSSVLLDLSARLNKLRSALTTLGVQRLPKAPTLSSNNKPTPRHLSSSFLEGQALAKKSNSRSRNSLPSTSGKTGNGALAKLPDKEVVSSSSGKKSLQGSSKAVSVLLTCDTCSLQRDQHLIVECDSCRKFYHLACLDPPLERMPKKVNFEWHCSDCVDESDSDKEDASNVNGASQEDDDNGREGARRKLRQRSDSVKAKKMAEAEDNMRAYRSAIARGSKRARGMLKEGGDGGISSPPSSASSRKFKRASIELPRTITSEKVLFRSPTVSSNGFRSPSTVSSCGSPTTKKAKVSVTEASPKKFNNSRMALVERRDSKIDEDGDHEKIIIFKE